MYSTPRDLDGLLTGNPFIDIYEFVCQEWYQISNWLQVTSTSYVYLTAIKFSLLFATTAVYIYIFIQLPTTRRCPFAAIYYKLSSIP